MISHEIINTLLFLVVFLVFLPANTGIFLYSPATTKNTHISHETTNIVLFLHGFYVQF